MSPTDAVGAPLVGAPENETGSDGTGRVLRADTGCGLNRLVQINTPEATKTASVLTVSRSPLIENGVGSGVSCVVMNSHLSSADDKRHDAVPRGTSKLTTFARTRLRLWPAIRRLVAIPAKQEADNGGQRLIALVSEAA